ncbi:MAG: PIN domain-containing protein [Candidatus Nanoarchaeia archaeon]
MTNEVLLDTSFILTCIKQKIDFLEGLLLMGYKSLIPNQVIKELEGLSKSNDNAKTALKILNSNKTYYKIINLEGKNTDNAIINYTKENPKTAIGTLDREIKKAVKNNKIVIRGKKRLEVI